MKTFAVLVCSLTLIVASLFPTEGVARQQTTRCDATTQATIRAPKEQALFDLLTLKDDIEADASLGLLSEAFGSATLAVNQLQLALDLIRDRDPCGLDADEAEVFFDHQGLTIEELMDFGSERRVPEGPLLDGAEHVVRTLLAADEALVIAMIALLPNPLPSGSSSDAFNPDQNLSTAQTLQDRCKLPPPGATRETDGTCDDAADEYGGIYLDIIEIIQ